MPATSSVEFLPAGIVANVRCSEGNSEEIRHMARTFEFEQQAQRSKSEMVIQGLRRVCVRF